MNTTEQVHVVDTKKWNFQMASLWKFLFFYQLLSYNNDNRKRKGGKCMSTITMVILMVYLVVFGGGSLFLVARSIQGGKFKAATDALKQTDSFSSRIGYILSTIGMAVGVGAMWRFPMMCAQYGGGSFVFAFVVVCIVIVIPAGWAESAFGRKTKKAAVGAMEYALGKKGRGIGYFMGATELGVFCYYPIVMALILAYVVYTFAGAPFLKDVEGFYNSLNGNRPLIYAGVLFVIVLTSIISLKGVEKGIERICKILLPLLFIFLIILTVRVCQLPGIAQGIEFYVKPDIKELANLKMWSAAAGMALFAVGLGPGCLLTYGMYLSDDSDLATDFITINVVQLTICILAGFVIIPPVVAFGLDPLAGKGLVFMAMPEIFSKIQFGMAFFVLYLVALFFAGLSSTLNQLEVPVACVMDGLKLSRTKAIAVCAGIAALVAIPCVWNDTFFMLWDNLIGNVGYCICALIMAVVLAWRVGAKKVREEWYNPTSSIQWGSWVDFLYKYIVVLVLLFFSITGIISLIQQF